MRLLLYIFCGLFFISSYSQHIEGKAFYKSNTATGRDYSDMPNEKRLRLEKRDKELYEKTFILTFNNKESIYKEKESLKETSPYMLGVLSGMVAYFNDKIYKNLHTDRIMEEREFLGKRFLIDDTLPKLQWQLEKESKQIGGYTVFKATATKQVDLNDYRIKYSIKKDAEGGNNKANILITAWYTPQIPVSNGPDEYSGLPGLILELNVGQTTFLCSKIILDTGKDTETINPPKNGEIVTFKEFDTVAKEKKKELKKKF